MLPFLPAGAAQRQRRWRQGGSGWEGGAAEQHAPCGTICEARQVCVWWGGGGSGATCTGSHHLPGQVSICICVEGRGGQRSNMHRAAPFVRPGEYVCGGEGGAAEQHAPCGTICQARQVCVWWGGGGSGATCTGRPGQVSICVVGRGGQRSNMHRAAPFVRPGEYGWVGMGREAWVVSPSLIHPLC